MIPVNGLKEGALRVKITLSATLPVESVQVSVPVIPIQSSSASVNVSVFPVMPANVATSFAVTYAVFSVLTEKLLIASATS